MTPSSGSAHGTLDAVLNASWTRDRAALTAACAGQRGAALRADPLKHWDAVWAIFGWLGVAAAMAELDRADDTTTLPTTRAANRRHLRALAHLLDGADELRSDPPLCTVPIETHLGLPTVAITIAERVTRWVIDSGSSTSAVNRELASHVPTIRTIWDAARITYDSAGNTIKILPGILAGAQLAGVTLPTVVVAVVDLPAAAGIDGVLSIGDLCTAASVDLDLHANRLTTTRATPATGASIDLRWVDDAPTVTADIAGHRTTLMIDTGAVVDIADPALVTQTGLPREPITHPGILAAAGGTDRTADRIQADVAVVGVHDRVAATFVVRACRPSPDALGPGTWLGLLGMPTLGNCRLVFDAGGARLWWHRPAVSN